MDRVYCVICINTRAVIRCYRHFEDAKRWITENDGWDVWRVEDEPLY
jgi:hypothetical protein